MREYVLPLDVTIPELNISHRKMTFLVDTGTITTTICGPDATSVDLSLLPNRRSQVSVDFQGETTPITSLQNCTLDYINEDKYSITLDLDIIVPIKEPKNKRTFMNSLSLLGMDFLESFKISFKNDCVYLEK